jgi:hypothetical protein
MAATAATELSERLAALPPSTAVVFQFLDGDAYYGKPANPWTLRLRLGKGIGDMPYVSD